MRRAATAFAMLALGTLMICGGCAKPPKPGEPLSGLTPNERALFERGRAQFATVFTPETGLGPVFNSDACAECHEDPAVGGRGDEVEVHVAAFLPEIPFCDPLVHKGGIVIQQKVTPALHAVLGIDSEPQPTEATAIAHRTTPDILGFGLLDAIPDSVILALADPDDRNHDGISGRPNRFFDGRLGRFGRKALVPTLNEFNGGAYVFEQGITSPAVPTEETVGGQPIPVGVDPVAEPEINQEALDLTNAFVRFLAPPAPQKLSTEGKRGRKLFTGIGCAGCHLPVLSTGDSPVKALRYKKVTAYTDLLLHDMGLQLADICLGQASPSEFRTEPLMGLRFSKESAGEGEPSFLHDGRARTIEDAIRMHGGEGAASRDKFAALSEAERAALLKFLESL
jgi:CxxC motif-containing protein (DUF1111 family)